MIHIILRKGKAETLPSDRPMAVKAGTLTRARVDHNNVLGTARDHVFRLPLSYTFHGRSSKHLLYAQPLAYHYDASAMKS
jgi:hypothetical protein